MKLRFILAIMTVVLIGAFGFVIPNVAHAQGVPASIGISITASPANPAPGDSVTLTAQSYTADINGATLTWSVNGSRIKSGVGETTLVITAPALGKTSTVSVSASTPAGQSFYNTLSIKSGSIDFIVESSGYTPPFFKGRLPVAYQNLVRMTAIPHLANSQGIEYSPTTLIYNWERDTGTVLSDQSGYGKQYIDLQGDIVPRPFGLTVTVSTKDGSLSTKGNVSVIPQDASLAFYVNDPLYGPLYNKAANDNINIGSQNEVSVVAVPYGFDKAVNAIGNLLLDWSINGTSRPELTSSNIVVLRAPNGSSGVSSIQLNINNNADILQRASNGFSATFK